MPAACSEQFAEGQLRLLPGQSCIFFIARAKAPVRSLHIELAPGQVGQVRFDPAGKNRFTVKQDLNANRARLKVDVYQEGGELQIECVAASVGDVCLLRIE